MLEKLTWSWQWFVLLAGIVSLYGVFIYRYAKNELIRLQPISFLLGCLLIFLMLGSPFTTLSQVSITLHMIQMSVLFFFVPPLLQLGIPPSLFDGMARWLKRSKLSSMHLSPTTSLSIFAILFLFYHTSIILTFLVSRPVVHTGYLLLLFLLSFGMWKPFASPDPLLRLCACKMKRYAFLSGLAITPACLLFIASGFFEGATNPLALQLLAHLCGPDFMDSFSLLPAPFHTKHDRILAGVLMMVLHKSSLVVTLKLERNISSVFYEKLERDCWKD
ncbi:cytochrome c oxidase assembly protein [Sporosarcina sp. Te-1]|uniref:cytochrome c oxidase assembly protein n=1 Tax=Sporosarcina sp. Te-1 TaxID=2818390 RepID=UPI001A9F14EA|nr:cytochrome c oxidase assembly protein [Sporosarcina sp. Te-1]QTD40311.1 cytochrome c oxidase assembly protein [Sporosarcina sp. Te-1]